MCLCLLRNCHYKHVNWCIKYPLRGHSNLQFNSITQNRKPNNVWQLKITNDALCITCL